MITQFDKVRKLIQINVLVWNRNRQYISFGLDKLDKDLILRQKREETNYSFV